MQHGETYCFLRRLLVRLSYLEYVIICKELEKLLYLVLLQSLTID